MRPHFPAVRQTARAAAEEPADRAAGEHSRPRQQNNIRTFLIFFPQSIATAENGKNGVMRSSPGPEPEKIKGARTPDEAG